MLRLPFVVFTIFFTLTFCQNSGNNHKLIERILIRHKQSKLVLDGSDHHVVLREYNNSPSQHWDLISTGSFIYMMKNAANGRVLAVEGTPTNGANVVCDPEIGGAEQEWVIDEKGIIVYLQDSNYILDVPDLPEIEQYKERVVTILKTFDVPPVKFQMEYARVPDPED